MNVKEVKNFRDNVAWVLGEFEVSQAVFAESAKISRVSLNRILMGHAVPGLDTCEDIAAACTRAVDVPRFNIRVNWLLESPAEFQRHFEKILHEVN